MWTWLLKYSLLFFSYYNFLRGKIDESRTTRLVWLDSCCFCCLPCNLSSGPFGELMPIIFNVNYRRIMVLLATNQIVKYIWIVKRKIHESQQFAWMKICHSKFSKQSIQTFRLIFCSKYKCSDRNQKNHCSYIDGSHLFWSNDSMRDYFTAGSDGGLISNYVIWPTQMTMPN